MKNPKHDRQGVRKASDIEQKYDLSLLNRFLHDNSQFLQDLSKLNELLTQNTTEVNARLEKLESKMFSVGSLHITLSEDDPASVFGGEWELIAEGYLVLGADSENELPELFQGEDKCFIWKRTA